MAFESVYQNTRAYSDQHPKPSGLRKKLSVFQQPHYLENLINSIFKKPIQKLILGRDGRYWSDQALKTVLKLAIAQNIPEIILGQNGIYSTPAFVYQMQQSQADFGILLTASHNPAGPEGDFGVKLYQAPGRPIVEQFRTQIFENTQQIQSYQILDQLPPDFDWDRIGCFKILKTQITILNYYSDYLDYLSRLFDFQKISDFFKKSQKTICYDAMHAVTGEYAKQLFESRLGFPEGTVIRSELRPNFSGEGADPTPWTLPDLFHIVQHNQSAQIGFASDGDGDRFFVVTPKTWVFSGDSLALFLEHADQFPQFLGGISGVARTVSTSSLIDRVARAKNIPCYVTPTGWCYFSDLLQSGKIQLCGEESFGIGANHLFEKDGLWSILAWLTLCVNQQAWPDQLLNNLWQKYGRVVCQRYDYLMPLSASELNQKLNTQLQEYRVLDNHFEWSRISGTRVAWRVSSTDTDVESSLLRIHIERYLSSK